jgi:hypothetical protein
MVNIVKRLSMSLFDDPASLVERNFLGCIAWNKNVATINRYVVDPFEGALKGQTPYSDDNIPESEILTPVDVEGLEFTVKTTPTTKNRPYKAVVDELENYLYVLVDKQYNKDIRRKSVVTLNDEPHISVDDVLGVMLERQVPMEKPSVNQSIIMPEGLVPVDPAMVSIALDRDYSMLNGFNARAYAQMSAFINSGNKHVKTFKEAVLNDLVEALGKEDEDIKTPDDIKKIVSGTYPFGPIEFLYQVEPRSSVSYSSIVNAFTKDAPKTVKKTSKIGDLHLAKMYCNGDVAALEEKGLIDEAFREAYRPKRREDRIFIRLQGLQDRLAYHTKTNTSPSLEKNLYMRPVE